MPKDEAQELRDAVADLHYGTEAGHGIRRQGRVHKANQHAFTKDESAALMKDLMDLIHSRVPAGKVTQVLISLDNGAEGIHSVGAASPSFLEATCMGILERVIGQGRLMAAAHGTPTDLKRVLDSITEE